MWQGRASSYDSRLKKKKYSIQCSICCCQFLVELQFFFHLFLSIGFESIDSFHFKKQEHACFAAKCEITDASMNPAC